MIITNTAVTQIKVMFRDDEKKKKKCNVTKEQLAGHVSEPLTKI